MDWNSWFPIRALDRYKLNPFLKVEYPVESEPIITLEGYFEDVLRPLYHHELVYKAKLDHFPAVVESSVDFKVYI